MSTQSSLHFPVRRPEPVSYARRVRHDRDASGDYDILIDGELRFRLECDREWPNFWYLYHVVDGRRAEKSLAMETVHWDMIHRLEHGEFWTAPARAEAACEF